MRRRPGWLLVVASLLAGCSHAATESAGAPEAGAADAGSWDRAALAADLTSTLAAEGLTVAEGSFGVFRVEDCAALATCFGNNPASPYGLEYVPQIAGEAQVDLPASLVRGATRTVWRMREDEAIVMIARTPPAARYLGVRSYVFSRGGQSLFASLGDTANELTLAFDGASAFDTDLVVVTTADRALDARLRQFFGDRGGAARVTTDVVSRDEAKLGLGADADALTMLVRVALFSDQAAGTSWLSAPPVTVLRVTPSAPRAIDPFPAPTLRTKGTGASEDGSGLAALEAAVRASFPSGAIDPAGVLPLTLSGLSCLASNTPCLGDNEDARYAASVPVTLGEGEALVVLGVDHTKAGKATYTSVAPYDATKQLGVGGLSDADFAGLAAAWLANDPRASGLYAVAFARDCKARPHCQAVPTSFPGIPLDAKVSIAERAYLEPATRTGPLDAELTRPRVLHVRGF